MWPRHPAETADQNNHKVDLNVAGRSAYHALIPMVNHLLDCFDDPWVKAHSTTHGWALHIHHCTAKHSISTSAFNGNLFNVPAGFPSPKYSLYTSLVLADTIHVNQKDMDPDTFLQS